MQHKKLLIIESSISLLLWITVMIIANSVIGNIPIILGGVIAIFFGVLSIQT